MNEHGDEFVFGAALFFETGEMPVVPTGKHAHRFDLIENESGDVLLSNVTMRDARSFLETWRERGSSYSFVESETRLPSGHILGHKLASADAPIHYDLTYVGPPTLCSPYRVDVVFGGDVIAADVSAATAEIYEIALLGSIALSLDVDFARFFDPQQSLLADSLLASWQRVVATATVYTPDPGLRFAPSPGNRRPGHSSPRPMRQTKEVAHAGLDHWLYQQAFFDRGLAIINVSTLDVEFVGLPAEVKSRLVPAQPCKYPKMADGQCSYHFTYQTEDGKNLHYRSEKRVAVDYRVVRAFRGTRTNGMFCATKALVTTPTSMNAGLLAPFVGPINYSILAQDYTVLDRETGEVLAIGSKKELMIWFAAAKSYGWRTANMKVERNDPALYEVA